MGLPIITPPTWQGNCALPCNKTRITGIMNNMGAPAAQHALISLTSHGDCQIMSGLKSYKVSEPAANLKYTPVIKFC